MILILGDEPRAARLSSYARRLPSSSPPEWNTTTALIAVYFGEDGRLQQKYQSTVHESVRPSVIDWLASRPRMIRRSLGF